MTSKVTDASQDELINLIYRHLKDNGYKKAANVLRKHAPQVETEEVKASLSEIFKEWASKRNEGLDDEDVPLLPSGIQTSELQSPAKNKTTSSAVRKSCKKHNTTGNTAPSDAVDTNSKKTSGSRSKSQKKKETVTIPKTGKTSTSQASKSKTAAVSVPPFVSSAPANDFDSDSDASLDVEKWRKLVTQLTDTDVAKMNVLSNFDESPVSSPGKSTEKGKTTKATKSKKEGDPTKNVKSKMPTKISRAKAANIPVKTDAAKTLSKKSKDKTAAAVSGLPEVKTPSKKAGDKKSSNISGHDVVETSKTNEANTEKLAVHDETNGLLKADKIATPSKRTKVVGGSDSESYWTPKKVKFKISSSLSEQVETPEIAASGTSETSTSETPSKKAKKKKSEILSDADNVEAPKKNVNSLSNTKKVATNASKLAQANCEDANPTIDDALLKSDQSEMPLKKLKDKKSKKVKTKKKKSLAEPDKAATSEKADVFQESVNPETLSKKAKKKKLEIQSESDKVETPKRTEDSLSNSKEVIKEVKKVKNARMPSQTNCEDANSAVDDIHRKSDQSETPSTKVKDEKSKSVEEPVYVETPKKVNATKTESLAELDKERTSEKADVLQELVNPQTPSKKSKLKAVKDLSEYIPGLSNEVASNQDLKTRSKTRKHKQVDPIDVLAPEEATPGKKKKKNTDGENVEVLQTAPEEAASVTVETSQKKKKKKKEEETRANH
ncbi:muscle M-line assembly protein unc-89 isoform X2 [Myxocyprinus asiaticus]|uniref:muscle M-line assembly protein unc-89 isoform X2 n=1 Tax=Myxocyprinus asiaticus TaxID=70543 RepID=UPI0022235DCC|nr:muscle M-line assembly protein unc-89 isoform X2 [Myxocyprinus asiaticus]